MRACASAARRHTYVALVLDLAIPRDDVCGLGARRRGHVKKVGGDGRSTAPAGHVAAGAPPHTGQKQLLLLLVPGIRAGRPGVVSVVTVAALDPGATPLRPTCGWVSRPCRRAWATCFPDGDACNTPASDRPSGIHTTRTDACRDLLSAEIGSWRCCFRPCAEHHQQTGGGTICSSSVLRKTKGEMALGEAAIPMLRSRARFCSLRPAL
jgi:hypothetical protein